MTEKGVSGLTGIMTHCTAAMVLQHRIRPCVTRRASSWTRVSIVIFLQCTGGVTVPAAPGAGCFTIASTIR